MTQQLVGQWFRDAVVENKQERIYACSQWTWSRRIPSIPIAPINGTCLVQPMAGYAQKSFKTAALDWEVEEEVVSPVLCRGHAILNCQKNDCILFSLFALLKHVHEFLDICNPVL